MPITTSLTALTDRALLDTAGRLAREERTATAALVRALMEIDRRRLYLGEGCASLFTYCTQVLHLSEGSAYNRIEAARAARRFPVILELFDAQQITLTTVRLLAPRLTAGNHVAVLDAARRKPKREIERLVAALAPRPDAPTMVRRVPGPQVPPLARLTEASGTGPGAPPAPRSAPCASRAASPPSPMATPLAADRYRIQVTVPRETHEKFRRAQALLRHAVPSGDPAEIFDRALTLLVEQLERQRCAETRRPQAISVLDRVIAHRPRSRHIPAAIRRAVWRRDQGRCAFVGAAGRCGETAWLEFHHVEPYAAGGDGTVENIALRCRAHNQYEGALYFGPVVEEGTGMST